MEIRPGHRRADWASHREDESLQGHAPRDNPELRLQEREGRTDPVPRASIPVYGHVKVVPPRLETYLYAGDKETGKIRLHSAGSVAPRRLIERAREAAQQQQNGRHGRPLRALGYTAGNALWRTSQPVHDRLGTHVDTD